VRGDSAFPNASDAASRSKSTVALLLLRHSLPFSFIAPAHLNHNHGHGHGHEGDLDLRSFQAWEDERPTRMGSLPSSPALIGSGEPDSWSTTPNRRDLVRHGQVLTWFLFDIVYASFFCNKRV
jgi:hypothetical protein